MYSAGVNLGCDQTWYHDTGRPAIISYYLCHARRSRAKTGEKKEQIQGIVTGGWVGVAHSLQNILNWVKNIRSFPSPRWMNDEQQQPSPGMFRWRSGAWLPAPGGSRRCGSHLRNSRSAIPFSVLIVEKPRSLGNLYICVTHHKIPYTVKGHRQKQHWHSTQDIVEAGEEVNDRLRQYRWKILQPEEADTTSPPPVGPVHYFMLTIHSLCDFHIIPIQRKCTFFNTI